MTIWPHHVSTLVFRYEEPNNAGLYAEDTQKDSWRPEMADKSLLTILTVHPLWSPSKILSAFTVSTMRAACAT